MEWGEGGVPLSRASSLPEREVLDARSGRIASSEREVAYDAVGPSPTRAL